jgi:hypothetical protein
MTTFMAWPEIEGFHNIRKFIRVDPGEWWRAKEQLSGTSIVSYKAKVKLHGTNAAVQVHIDGTILPQSRTNLITPEGDNAGFARWVMSHKEAWMAARGMIIYGEWCGPGIQKGVAISEIPKKVFAVFAARPLDDSDRLIVEPEDLASLVVGIPDTYILPWYARTPMYGMDTRVDVSLDINWKQSDEDLTKSTVAINDWVAAVEANDPWVEAAFGVKGTGEGLVFYPVSEPHLGWDTFQNLVFKAKGEKHKNIATAKPAQISAEAAASIDAFVSMVLTQARLEQGATAIGGTDDKHPDLGPWYDVKLTGKFVAWIELDIKKETQDELEASKLDWKQIQKPLSDKARAWYLIRAKK